MFDAALAKIHLFKNILFLLILLTISSTLCFYRLGECTLQNDEALYAHVVNNILDTGNWIYPQAYGEPYTHKPPLYFWLTATTADWIKDEEVRFRVWSALFGVGCTLLTFFLGSKMFTPEIGFIAALILCMNKSFLFMHSMREGTMESAVTFLALAALMVFWKQPSLKRPDVGWIVIGLSAGLMCLFKPLVGFVLLIPIFIHWQLYDVATRWRSRVIGPFLAVIVCMLVFVPWHVLQWIEFGSRYFFSALNYNIVERMTVGIDPRHIEGPWYYWIEASNSSNVFKLFVPSLMITLIWSRFGDSRRAYGLLAIIIVFWVVGFSLSSSKRLWYIFPIFPMISLSLAAVGVETSTVFLSLFFKANQTNKLLFAGMMVICFLAFGNWINLLLRKIPFNIDRLQSVPMALYESVGPEHIPGIRFVFYDPPNTNWNHIATYYYPRLSETIHVHAPDELERLMSEAQPTILVFNDDAPDSLVENMAERFCATSCTWLQGRWGNAFIKNLGHVLPLGLNRWVHGGP